jgi:ADP-ribosylglycohydrolase
MTELQNHPTASRLDRITGALLGVHAGDSLGATLEFCTWAQICSSYPEGLREIIGGGAFGWPAGHATDDTDLTRAILLAYLAPGDDIVRTAAGTMLEWYTGDWPDRTPGDTPVDVGGATQTGLLSFRRTGDPRSSGAGEGQAGNGSLMRCIATGLAVSDPERRVRESIEISAITHDDARCTVSCAAYNEIVAALIGSPGDPDLVPVDTAVAAGLATAESLGIGPVVEAITYGTKLSLPGAVQTGQTFLDGDGSGYVLDSLSLAIAAVLDPRSLEDVLVDVVRLGRDTDTNAAIAGGLLGARDGAGAIPPRWREKLQFGPEFEAAAREIANWAER